MATDSDYPPIEDHGVVGDLGTVALIGIDGSVDFLCFPDFDSPTVFARLLDVRNGGHFTVAPLECEKRSSQMYLPDTNVLLTRFLADGGVAELVDFMPIHAEGSERRLLRQVRMVSGQLRFRITCAPRFDYARADHEVRREADGAVSFIPRSGGLQRLHLRASVPLAIDGGDACAELVLGEGDSVQLSLGQAGTPAACEARDPLQPDGFEASVRETAAFWRHWASHATYSGRWPEMVRRSALTLKLLTSREHGSLVAAPTFGLPEALQGVRNWDYRYTWIRDSAFTLRALILLGYTAEAKAFMRWVEERCHHLDGDEPLQALFGIDGRKDLTEIGLEHLAGYRGSQPVRIGNQAHRHLQLDIYGALLDTVYLFNKHGEPISYDLWRQVVRLVDWVCDNHGRPDRSIWEVRGETREFLYSRLMCWVAVDRALRLAAKRSFPAPMERWVRVRDEIFDDVQNGFWHRERAAFVQARSSEATDASALIMPLIKFLGPTDPRWISTLRAIEEELIGGSLVRRYRTADGLPGAEGSFTMCSFWYAECLAKAGRIDEARLVFEKMLGFANHLGLYAEMIGPRGQHLGNTPQALTHLALISAAWSLDQALDRTDGGE